MLLTRRNRKRPVNSRNHFFVPTLEPLESRVVLDATSGTSSGFSLVGALKPGAVFDAGANAAERFINTFGDSSPTRHIIADLIVLTAAGADYAAVGAITPELIATARFGFPLERAGAATVGLTGVYAAALFGVGANAAAGDDFRANFGPGVNEILSVISNALKAFIIRGTVQMSQATQDPAGIDDFSGTYTFTFHAASLSGQQNFTATGFAANLECTGNFSGSSFAGFWKLIEPDTDKSDTGQGFFSLK